MIAAVNTSFEQPAFAVGECDRLLAVASTSGWPADLTDMAARALREAGQEADSALEGVVVATGPGRFGSLRGGIAFAKGLALARYLPLVGVPTAAAVAEAAGAGDAVVVSPAGRGRWYVVTPVEFDRIQLVNPEEVAQRVPADLPVAGPLDSALTRALEDSGRQVRRVDDEAVLRALVRLARRRLEEGRGPATMGARPVYAAPATRARRWAGGGVGGLGRTDG